MPGAESEKTSHPTAPPQSASFRLALLAVMVIGVLACLGTSTWLLASRGADTVGISGQSQDLQRQRDEVMSQAQQFLLRMGTFGPDLLQNGTMPEYRKRVGEIITPKFRTSFDKQVGAAEQMVSQAGVSRKAAVFATGVSSMDADSAHVLVAGTFTQSYPDRKGNQVSQEPQPFRLDVTLVKSGDRWLVDDFSPVTEAVQQ
jgi:Mce-associated membrane protein